MFERSSDRGFLSSSCAFHVSFNSRSLDRSRKKLDFLRGHSAPKFDEPTEVGYAIYYKLTKQNEKAKHQIDYVLRMFPNTQRKEKLLNFKNGMDTHPVKIVK